MFDAMGIEGQSPGSGDTHTQTGGDDGASGDGPSPGAAERRRSSAAGSLATATPLDRAFTVDDLLQGGLHSVVSWCIFMFVRCALCVLFSY